MLKKISNLPFKGTAEQEKKLWELIDANKHDKSLLMAVMQGYPNLSLVTRVFVCYQTLEIALKLYNNNCLDFEEFDCAISL